MGCNLSAFDLRERNMKTRTKTLIMAGTLCALNATAAPIILNNAGFETGDLSGWSTIGGVIATPTTTVTTFNGVNWNIQAAETTMAQLSPDGTPIANIESALGIAAGTLDSFNTNPNGGNLTDGAELYQSFTANPGDSISFYWNYVATDYIPYNDPAFAILIGPSNLVEVLASTHGLGIAVGTAGNSGWINYSKTLGGGNYILAFVTTNDKDQALDSVLHIDNVAGTCTPNCPSLGGVVPEIDAAAGTGALGLLGGVLVLTNERRKRRQ
jgi:hypothetical protein